MSRVWPQAKDGESRGADLTRTGQLMGLPYRPEVDGLRAIAVIAILLFHADLSVLGLKLVKGGFLGVDVFFVISGYLIARIIFSEIKDDRFSLVTFYQRRARRILPALFLVTGACYPAAWFGMTPEQLENFSRSAVAASLFASNIFFWLDTNYFAESIALKPLSHAWSLAVEEQFYVFFPVFLVAVIRTRVSTGIMFAIVAGVSFLLAHALNSKFPEAAFYLLPTRVWEFIAGAALAHREGSVGRKRIPALDRIAPGLGIAGLSFAFFCLDGSIRHPGFLTLVPVISTMAIIWYTGRSDFCSAILSSRACVGVGLISYSLYLWHQPLFSFAKIYSINDVSPLARVVLIFLAIVLAYLSWRFVEQPFRRPVVGGAKIWVSACVGLALVATPGCIGYYSNGFPSRMPLYESLAKVEVGYKTLGGELCTRDNCIVGKTGVQPSVVLIGDSHAGVLARSFEKTYNGSDKAALVLANGDMFVDKYPPFYDAAERYNLVLKGQQPLVLAPEMRTVILSARYTLRVENVPFDNGEGGVELLPAAYRGRSADEKSIIMSSIDRATRELLERGKRVVLVYPIPEAGWDVPATLRKLQSRHKDAALTTSYEVYRNRNRLIIELFDAIPDSANLIKVRPDRIFCNTFIVSRCATHSYSDVFYFDDDHLSIAGADLVVAAIIRAAKESWGGLD